MRVVPLSYNEYLSVSEIDRHECSDRIMVPQRMFERWMSEEDAGSVVLVALEGIAACMYAPHCGPRDVIYAPMWMCEALRVSLDPPDDADAAVDDYIVPVRIRPAMCTFMRIQPHTSDHLHIPNTAPEDVLSRGFEEYTCVRSGQTLMLRLETGERMFVSVVATEPDNSGPVCIRSPEIFMDMLEALDVEEPPAVARPPTPRPALDLPLLTPLSPPGSSPTPPTHHTSLPTLSPPSEQPQHFAPVAPSRDERRRLAAEAAMRRQHNQAS